MDRYTDILKSLRDPKASARRPFYRRRKFWIRISLVLIVAALILRIPICWSSCSLMIGDLFLSLDRKSTALVFYRSALSATPHHLVALEKCGMQLSECGYHKEALAVFQEFLRQNGDQTKALSHLAQVSLKLKDYEGALPYAQQWVSAAPASSLAYRCRGRALDGLGRFEEAEDDYERSLKLDPHSEAAVDMDQMLQQKGYSHHSFESLTEPKFENKPNDYEAQTRDSLRLWFALEQEKSLEKLLETIKLKPERPLAYFVRGRLMVSLNRRYEEALHDLQAAEARWHDEKDLVITPAGMQHDLAVPRELSKAMMYSGLASAFIGLGDRKKALFYANKAVFVDPKDAGNFRLRALIYRDMHEMEKYRQDMKAAQSASTESRSRIEGLFLQN